MKTKKTFAALVVALVAAVSLFSVTAFAEGGNVAKTGDVEYATLEAAVNAAAEGGTIELISDMSDIGTISLGKSLTIAGNGHTISGNSCFYANKAADTVFDNVVFKNISNSGSLTAIYASGLTKSITIKNCVFDNIEYECLQTTPTNGAKITVTNNTFKRTASGNKIKRYIHIESQQNADITAVITGNKFYNASAINDSAIEAYYFKDKDNICIADNYFDASYSENLDKMACILMGYGTNVSYQVFPIYKNEDMTESYAPAACTLSTYYIKAIGTLQEMINTAGGGATVKLVSDTTEDVVVPTGKTVTINLNGYTLTNASNHTIINKGNLTITGDGTVDNVTHGRAAVYNEVGATATLASGTYTRSKEAGAGGDNNGGNSYYTIFNHGTMTIKKDVTVVNNGHYSSMLENGWQDGTKNTTSAVSKLTINGGIFTGGINTIKNDDYGELEINDGTFTNQTQYAVMNWNVATINGGDFETSWKYALSNGYYNDTYNKGQLTVTGGVFNAGIGIEEKGGKIAISGGTFPVDVAEYAVDGYKSIQNDDSTYTVRKLSEATAQTDTVSNTEGTVAEALAKNNLDANTTRGDVVTVTADGEIAGINLEYTLNDNAFDVYFATPGVTANGEVRIGVLLYNIPAASTLSKPTVSLVK